MTLICISGWAPKTKRSGGRLTTEKLSNSGPWEKSDSKIGIVERKQSEVWFVWLDQKWATCKTGGKLVSN